ncbi:DUF485 domain-containing protein [Streptomyces sp. Amel2xB2]|uniref:DUF485 domain-containing protein n=1 Tax=Streptomyces sp. Amel2xB2 TaxID=1305829 RepID=UPI0011B9436E|nr:DUF485 domain-containing protein [Streptomyces sp. Amel2xB2]
MSVQPRGRARQTARNSAAGHGSSGFLRRDSMRSAYRTGSSSEALTAARRVQLTRGLGLVLGVFAAYAVVSCFLPGLLTTEVFQGVRVLELGVLTQVSAIVIGVYRHDRHARRHVEPLAQRVVTRQPAAAAEPAEEQARPADPAAFNAFDSARAFRGTDESRGMQGVHRASAHGPRRTARTAATARAAT